MKKVQKSVVWVVEEIANFLWVVEEREGSAKICCVMWKNVQKSVVGCGRMSKNL